MTVSFQPRWVRDLFFSLHLFIFGILMKASCVYSTGSRKGRQRWTARITPSPARRKIPSCVQSPSVLKVAFTWRLLSASLMPELHQCSSEFLRDLVRLFVPIFFFIFIFFLHSLMHMMFIFVIFSSTINGTKPTLCNSCWWGSNLKFCRVRVSYWSMSKDTEKASDENQRLREASFNYCLFFESHSLLGIRAKHAHAWRWCKFSPLPRSYFKGETWA